MGMWVVVVGGGQRRQGWCTGQMVERAGRRTNGQATVGEHVSVCHRKAIVRQTDTSDPDPAEVPKLMGTFFGRMDLLFSHGHVVNMEHSFTAQILRFLRFPSIILAKKYAVMFAIPAANQADAILEPLERMREICKNVKACVLAAMPDSAWQVQFGAFWLPSAIGASRPGQPATQARVRQKLRRIFEWLPQC